MLADLLAPPRRPRAREEDDFREQVETVARMLGYLVHHSLRSEGSEPGFPDDIFVSAARCRTIYVEFKSSTGRVSTRRRVTRGGRVLPSQADWIEALRAAGAEVYVWRPADLEDAVRILEREGPCPS